MNQKRKKRLFKKIVGEIIEGVIAFIITEISFISFMMYSTSRLTDNLFIVIGAFMFFDCVYSFGTASDLIQKYRRYQKVNNKKLYRTYGRRKVI